MIFFKRSVFIKHNPFVFRYFYLKFKKWKKTENGKKENFDNENKWWEKSSGRPNSAKNK